ncbi:MAG: phage major capsid protein [Actinobacteria bacterium]|nr:phage major capsid protein [Actinomycetota bacterium]
MTAEEIQALRDEAARQLDAADDITRTAQEAGRGLTPDERTAHDATIARHDALVSEIARATDAAGDAVRFDAADVRRSRSNVPNVNLNRPTVGDGVTRDLDHFLWSTSDTVRASAGTAQIPVEQVVIRAKLDNGPGKVAPRINAFRAEDREVVRAFQATVAEMAIVGMLVDRDANTSAKGFQLARSLPQYKDRWSHILRALDVDTSTAGTEWVPTGIGATLHEKVRASGRVAPLFARINLPTSPWKWPIEGTDLTAYRVAEPTSDTASKVTPSTGTTVAAQFDAEIFGARTLWSKTLDVESAIAMAAFQQARLVQSFVDAEEKAILDGDTDGTHMDTDVHALGATDARLAWDGLRKKGIAQTTPATAQTATSVANLLLLRKAMGKWGVNPASLAYIVGVSALHTLLSDTNLLTVDKLGPNATILNGMIGMIGGVPVVVSEHIREDLNASGVNDGITTTKTYNLCVNRDEFAIGQRMALDVETNDVLYAETFQRVAYAFMREDFQHIGGAAANDDVAIAYNITP